MDEGEFASLILLGRLSHPLNSSSRCTERHPHACDFIQCGRETRCKATAGWCSCGHVTLGRLGLTAGDAIRIRNRMSQTRTRPQRRLAHPRKPLVQSISAFHRVDKPLILQVIAAKEFHCQLVQGSWGSSSMPLSQALAMPCIGSVTHLAPPVSRSRRRQIPSDYARRLQCYSRWARIAFPRDPDTPFA